MDVIQDCVVEIAGRNRLVVVGSPPARASLASASLAIGLSSAFLPTCSAWRLPCGRRAACLLNRLDSDGFKPTWLGRVPVPRSVTARWAFALQKPECRLASLTNQARKRVGDGRVAGLSVWSIKRCMGEASSGELRTDALAIDQSSAALGL